MNFIIRLLITAVVAFFLPKILSGVQFDSFQDALIFAVVLALLNMFLRPILGILGLPITIVTFGLFSLVLNTLVVMVANYFVSGMHIDGFWWAFIFSILLSLLTSVLNGIFTSSE